MYEDFFELGQVLDFERRAESQTWARDWDRLVTAEARVTRREDTARRKGTTVVAQRESGHGALAYLQLLAGLWPR
jgi:hypothetical protein